MRRPKVEPKTQKAVQREILRIERKFGGPMVRVVMRRHLNLVKERAKREQQIRKLRSELAELGEKS